jgi:hypothetical protein
MSPKSAQSFLKRLEAKHGVSNVTAQMLMVSTPGLYLTKAMANEIIMGETVATTAFSATAAPKAALKAAEAAEVTKRKDQEAAEVIKRLEALETLMKETLSATRIIKAAVGGDSPGAKSIEAPCPDETTGVAMAEPDLEGAESVEAPDPKEIVGVPMEAPDLEAVEAVAPDTKEATDVPIDPPVVASFPVDDYVAWVKGKLTNVEWQQFVDKINHADTAVGEDSGIDGPLTTLDSADTTDFLEAAEEETPHLETTAEEEEEETSLLAAGQRGGVCSTARRGHSSLL